MTETVKLNGTSISVMKGDITDLDIQSFVFYAREDLKLGSGFGTAIAVRGGQTIQEELDGMAPARTTEVVLSKAGELKAESILHAVGPKFQEENLEDKLRATILNTLKKANEAGIKRVAFPPMGTGFYGVPLEVSAEITFDAISDYLKNSNSFEEIVICVLDNREFKPFAGKLSGLGQA